MKELEENTIEQIRTLLNYLEQTDLFKNKDIARWCVNKQNLAQMSLTSDLVPY